MAFGADVEFSFHKIVAGSRSIGKCGARRRGEKIRRAPAFFRQSTGRPSGWRFPVDRDCDRHRVPGVREQDEKLEGRTDSKCQSLGASEVSGIERRYAPTIWVDGIGKVRRWASLQGEDDQGQNIEHVQGPGNKPDSANRRPSFPSHGSRHGACRVR